MAETVDVGGAVTVVDKRAVMGSLTVTPARLVDDALEVEQVSGLPAEFEGGEVMAGFPPSPKFEKKGETVFGAYVGMRLDVGPNKSRVYELSQPGPDGEALTIAVWGSTAIDRLFDSAYPPIQQGDKLAFIYLGEKGTKRNQNPVKLFALKIKRQTVPA